ncbi:MAG: ATP-binding protein [Bacteroidaceae bacterium]|nr:ATP-binding protein [Bacteroidaceae bacterium]
MEKKGNPWLGLESYREGDILYGRDEDIRDLTQCVLNDQGTLFYGKSGIGKSSILNAGIIPAARRNGFLPIMVRLSHKDGDSKEDSYLSQIKKAIEDAMIPIPLDEQGNQRTLSDDEKRNREANLANRIKQVVACGNPKEESLYEFFHRHTFHASDGTRIKLLIFFDQFEEIFTLQGVEARKRSFFAELADFLNDIMPSELQQGYIVSSDTQKEITVLNDESIADLFNDINLKAKDNAPDYVTDNEVHLVFTIREDFLSEFEYYSASIPSLKQNRYGLRPISEEQAAQIIMRPVPGLISEQVAKLIIEKVTGKTDFKLDGVPEIEVSAAMLSLYLNRLYDAHTEDTITGELVEKKANVIISELYADAISNISEKTVKYLEENLLTKQGRRDIKSLSDAVRGDGVPKEELDFLCSQKKILRQFNYAGDLRIEFVHDILCPIVQAHKEERVLQKQQEEERIRQEKLLAEMEKKNKRMRIGQSILIGFILILMVGGGWLVWQLKDEKPQMLDSELYRTVTLDIDVDSAFADKPRWGANVLIKKMNDSLLGTFPVDSSTVKISFQLHDSIYQHDSIQICVVPTDTLKMCVNTTSILHPSDSIEPKIVHILYNRNTRYTLKGRVVYNPNPKKEKTIPVNQAYVSLNGEMVRTDSAGYFLFSFEDPLKTKKGLLTVSKRDFKPMQYELANQIQPVEVNLPLCEDVPLETLFARKGEAIDRLFKVSAKEDNRNTETTDDERRWMCEVAVLDTVKSNLRKHFSSSTVGLFSEVYFLSRENGIQNDVRPVYGWYVKRINKKLVNSYFYGTMVRLNEWKKQEKNAEYWRIYITSFKNDFHTEEHSFIMKNPRAGNGGEVVEIEY